MSSLDPTANDDARKAVWNVAGAVVGALLAAIAIFGIVSSQAEVASPSPYTDVIDYNS